MCRFLCLAVLALASCNAQNVQRDLESAASPICTLRNSYYKVEGSCDSYVECKDFVANQMMCPDGLHYNPAAVWPAYPCAYSIEISCEGRGAPQPAIPTPECPHQYGFFPSPQASPQDCGVYRMCVAGQAIEMMCPPGLAFNMETAHCDWPDRVPTCDVESFLGFKCPALPPLENGEVNGMVVSYLYEDNCYAYYSCERGYARLLTCDAGFAFDATTGQCEDDSKVQCSQR